ncbi:MAG: hypothetical protein ABIS36_22635 [Chryseolinea sp.]
MEIGKATEGTHSISDSPKLVGTVESNKKLKWLRARYLLTFIPTTLNFVTFTKEIRMAQRSSDSIMIIEFGIGIAAFDFKKVVNVFNRRNCQHHPQQGLAFPLKNSLFWFSTKASGLRSYSERAHRSGLD